MSFQSSRTNNIKTEEIFLLRHVFPKDLLFVFSQGPKGGSLEPQSPEFLPWSPEPRKINPGALNPSPFRLAAVET